MATDKKKDPKRVAAGKKAARARARKTSPKRRKRSLSAKSGRRKGILSQILPASPAASRGAADAMLSGAVGGALGGGIEQFVGAGKPIMDRLIGIGIGAFVVGAMFDLPKTAAGMAGAAGYMLFRDWQGLSEGGQNMQYHSWVDEETLSQYPMMIDEPYVNMSEPAYQLSDPAYQLSNGYIPGYNY